MCVIFLHDTRSKCHFNKRNQMNCEIKHKNKQTTKASTIETRINVCEVEIIVIKSDKGERRQR